MVFIVYSAEELHWWLGALACLYTSFRDYDPVISCRRPLHAHLNFDLVMNNEFINNSDYLQMQSWSCLSIRTIYINSLKEYTYKNLVSDLCSTGQSTEIDSERKMISFLPDCILNYATLHWCDRIWHWMKMELLVQGHFYLYKAIGLMDYTEVFG